MTDNKKGGHDIIDSGWAWVILFAATATMIVCSVMIYCTGVMHVALLRRFKGDNAYTSMIGSINSGLMSLVGPLAGACTNAFSCRVAIIVGGMIIFLGYGLSAFVTSDLDYILLTYGIVAGTGLGFLATPAISSVGYYFKRRYGIAVGIMMSGAGVGTFITGPFVQFLLNNFGLEGTFLILAGVGSQTIVFGALMRPLYTRDKSSIHQKNKKEKESSKPCFDMKNILHFDILLDKKFMCCSLQFLLWNMAFSIIMLHLVNYSIMQGTERDSAALLITYAGITSTFGRIITGLAINQNGVDPILLNFGFCGILTFLTFPFPFYSRTFGGQVIFSLLFGLYGGGLSTLMNPLCMELLGMEKVASGIGTLFFLGGIGYMAGPPIAGIIVDSKGTYEYSFYLCGCLFLLASFTTLVAASFKTSETSLEELALSLNDLQDPKIKIINDRLLGDVNVSIEILPQRESMCEERLFEEINETTPFSTSLTS